MRRDADWILEVPQRRRRIEQSFIVYLRPRATWRAGALGHNRAPVVDASLPFFLPTSKLSLSFSLALPLSSVWGGEKGIYAIVVFAALGTTYIRARGLPPPV